jgi:ElaB/YqjD/DUF883 family membrane-anchored ribosome-binding protein
MDASEANEVRRADEEAGVGAAPVAADRPVVDGTSVSPDQLRAEVEQTQDIDTRPVEELRADVADTVQELSARLDVPSRVKQQASANLQATREVARENPGILAAAAASVALVVIALWRRSRRSGRA